MCLDFDGHHFGGSSFDLYIIFDYVIRCGPYPQVPDWFKKKKSGKESQHLVSHPGNRFGSANRVGQGSGRGRTSVHC